MSNVNQQNSTRGTNRQTDRTHTDIRIDNQAHRQTERQTDRLTARGTVGKLSWFVDDKFPEGIDDGNQRGKGTDEGRYERWISAE